MLLTSTACTEILEARVFQPASCTVLPSQSLRRAGGKARENKHPVYRLVTRGHPPDTILAVDGLIDGVTCTRTADQLNPTRLAVPSRNHYVTFYPL